VSTSITLIDNRYFRSGLYPAPKTPLTLGREGAGIVTAVGEGVTNFKQGDRVAYMGMEVTLRETC
jgi:NADPH:quinone reductase